VAVRAVAVITEDVNALKVNAGAVKAFAVKAVASSGNLC
jgi:hypothetical protein